MTENVLMKGTATTHVCMLTSHMYVNETDINNEYSCLQYLAFNLPYSIFKFIMEVWYFDNTLAQL